MPVFKFKPKSPGGEEFIQAHYQKKHPTGTYEDLQDGFLGLSFNSQEEAEAFKESTEKAFSAKTGSQSPLNRAVDTADRMTDVAQGAELVNGLMGLGMDAGGPVGAGLGGAVALVVSALNWSALHGSKENEQPVLFAQWQAVRPSSPSLTQPPLKAPKKRQGENGLSVTSTNLQGYWQVTGKLSSNPNTYPELEKIKAAYSRQFKTTPRGKQRDISWSETFNAFGAVKAARNFWNSFTGYDAQHAKPTIKEAAGSVNLLMKFKDEEEANTFFAANGLNEQQAKTAESTQSRPKAPVTPTAPVKQKTKQAAPSSNAKKAKEIIDAYHAFARQDLTEQSSEHYTKDPKQTEKGVVLTFPNKVMRDAYLEGLAKKGVKFTAHVGEQKVASCAGGENKTVIWEPGQKATQQVLAAESQLVTSNAMPDTPAVKKDPDEQPEEKRYLSSR